MGLIYFVWSVLGLAITLFSFIFIIGIPMCLLFFGSIRVIALVESRLIETLLGARMPRRPIFSKVNGNILSQFWALVKNPESWTILIYLILMAPLGITYFLIAVCMLGTAVEFLFVPFFPHPAETARFCFELAHIEPSPWMLSFTLLISFFLIVLTLHVVKAIGRFHARFAKGLLVARSARFAAKSE
jgi:hypothetical protein